jgi:hypothetical protein
MLAVRLLVGFFLIFGLVYQTSLYEISSLDDAWAVSGASTITVSCNGGEPAVLSSNQTVTIAWNTATGAGVAADGCTTDISLDTAILGQSTSMSGTCIVNQSGGTVDASYDHPCLLYRGHSCSQVSHSSMRVKDANEFDDSSKVVFAFQTPGSSGFLGALQPGKSIGIIDGTSNFIGVFEDGTGVLGAGLADAADAQQSDDGQFAFGCAGNAGTGGFEVWMQFDVMGNTISNIAETFTFSLSAY